MLKLIYNFNRRIFKTFFLKKYPKIISIYFHHIDDEIINQIISVKEYFTKKGYKIIDSTNILDNKSSKLLYFSFDDNYKSWINYSDVLLKHKIKSTFFVNTLPFDENEDLNNYYNRLDFKGDRTPLSKSDLINLHNKGFRIGSHSHSHFNLAKISFSKAKKEILKNKKYLEDIIKQPITDFSFPFGMPKHFNKQLHDFCLSVGFKTINYATPCMLYEKSKRNKINRYPWKEKLDFDSNLINIRIDGELFIKFFNKSPIG